MKLSCFLSLQLLLPAYYVAHPVPSRKFLLQITRMFCRHENWPCLMRRRARSHELLSPFAFDVRTLSFLANVQHLGITAVYLCVAMRWELLVSFVQTAGIQAFQGFVKEKGGITGRNRALKNGRVHRMRCWFMGVAGCWNLSTEFFRLQRNHRRDFRVHFSAVHVNWWSTIF